MNKALEQPRTVWTEDMLTELPEDGFMHEVVNGELVMSPKNKWFHGRICTRLLLAIGSFVKQHRLGAVLDSSTGFWMFNRNCRAPDVSFVSKARMEELGFQPRALSFFPGAPDLAIEGLSENHTRSEMQARLKDFFGSGTQLAWIIDPNEQTVEGCHALTRRQLIGAGGLLDGQSVLPGFQYPIADLFKDWDWD